MRRPDRPLRATTADEEREARERVAREEVARRIRAIEATLATVWDVIRERADRDAG